MSIEFARTPMGRQFFEQHLPELIRSIQELVKELKRSNDLKEKAIN